MYPKDYNYDMPAVPPLYPMDPCRPSPMPYEPMPYEPMPEPMWPNMPMCPMMNPAFRQCVQVCMMQCGMYNTPMGMNDINPYNPEDVEVE